MCVSQQPPSFDAVDTAAADLEHPTARATRRRVSYRPEAGESASAGTGGADGQPEESAMAAAVKEIRKRTGHSQRGFWPLFGVTQTAGCRYEKDGREVPTPVLMLVLGYGEGVISRAMLADLKELVRRSGKNKQC
jgi:hypothetical protein